ncbi:MAG: RelA/SpoT domain-containing protein [Anaerolineales bacterium]|nr:MAG: RelA/SpoT domain-containing protein [Anaerolineales bacterium]
MRFSPVPSESREKINEAGKILASDNPTQQERTWALDLAERWRACHAYPINTFQATLRDKTRNFQGEPIVAQRLKRMPTIIDKLRRYPSMSLSRMQDIGGVRAILGSFTDVERLAHQYLKNQNFTHELSTVRDYITNPRDEDGYRSLHLVYKYRNPRNPDFDGLRLEMQLRTRRQHIWATAVETMGFVLKEPLKSRRGSQAWIDFFAILASAFAHQEGTPLVPRFAHLNYDETIKELARVEKDLGALIMISGVSAAAEHILKNQKGSSYHLLVLDTNKRTVNVKGYDRDSFAAAEKDYSYFEKRIQDGEDLEPVLVSAGPIDRLRSAYPNFFLDIRDLEKAVRELLS